MTVKGQTLVACKAIAGSPIRRDMAELVYALNHAKAGEAATDSDRSHFGYVARHLRSQALGYVLVDLQRAELAKDPFHGAIPELTDAERSVLRSAHGAVLRLNNLCIAHVVQRIASASRAVDPYSRLRPVDITGVNIVDLIPPDTVSRLREEFAMHPAIPVAEQSSSLVKPMDEAETEDAVIRLNEELNREERTRVPEEITRIALGTRLDDPVRMSARYLLALLSIRLSLANMDQLLFQAMTTDRLVTLTEDNIIEVGPLTHNMLGYSTTIELQVEDRMYEIEVGDILLVKCPSLPTPFDMLAHVEAQELHMAGEEGDWMRISIRALGETLSPYEDAVRLI